MKEVQYVEVRELQNRGPVDPAPPEEVDGTLLVGTTSAFRFECNFSSYGNDMTTVSPAFHNGKRCWLRCDVWCPAGGYSASGNQDSILSFEDGAKLFLERGVFEFPYPEA